MTSPNGDQHQFSPNDIHTLSREWELMKRSLKRKCLDLSSNPLNTFFMEMLEISLENLYLDIGELQCTVTITVFILFLLSF